jgi:quercetin dioxygenase-like cupin family protein
MGFIELSSTEKKQLREGIQSRIFSGEKIMMAFMDVAPNLSDPGHDHPHEQCGIVLEGEIEMTIGDEVRLLKEGDAYFIPGGLPHGGKTFEKPCLVLDIFSPPREDYK